jgi:TRAP transporter TAXI family solute receptor
MKRAGLRASSVVAALVALVALSATNIRAEDILIGTGSTSGVYYPAGRAICRLINKNVDGLTCKAEPSAGSLANLTNVAGGAIEIGIAQSDWQYYAVTGTGPVEFVDTGFDNLRAMFSLHGEPFTVVARADSGIKTFDDLKGKRVNIGNPGSGQRATMEVVMAAKGWTRDDFVLAEELPAEQQSLALCHNRVQAMVYTVGHPNPSIGQAAGLCNGVIVEVKGGAIDKLVQDNPYYAYTAIPGGMYAGNPDSVVTFGVKATVVSSADVDSDLVYAVVKAVFENLDTLRRMHPAFGLLDAKNMVRDGLSAPLHEGAERYFREKGLL